MVRLGRCGAGALKIGLIEPRLQAFQRRRGQVLDGRIAGHPSPNETLALQFCAAGFAIAQMRFDPGALRCGQSFVDIPGQELLELLMVRATDANTCAHSTLADDAVDSPPMSGRHRRSF